MRFGHGELHLALLGLMSQRPMHGYELMAELSTRIGRKYRASPGSIYPAVQALEAEGLISGADESDKRIYSSSPTRRKAALENRAHRLAALESRLGVRFTRGVDPDLARFAERIRAVAPRLPNPCCRTRSMLQRRRSKGWLMRGEMVMSDAFERAAQRELVDYQKLGFRLHLYVYLAVQAMLVATWALTSRTDDGFGFPWPVFVILGWGIGLAAHYAVYSVTRRRPRSEVCSSGERLGDGRDARPRRRVARHGTQRRRLRAPPPTRGLRGASRSGRRARGRRRCRA